MTIWAFRTMIVPSDYRDLAASLASALGGTAGEDMFTTGLSASGQEPATHYVSTGYVANTLAEIFPITPNTPGNVSAAVSIAQDAGLSITAEQVTDLFAAIDVTEQEPFLAFDRLDLKLAHNSNEQ